MPTSKELLSIYLPKYSVEMITGSLPPGAGRMELLSVGEQDLLVVNFLSLPNFIKSVASLVSTYTKVSVYTGLTDYPGIPGKEYTRPDLILSDG